MHPLRLAAVKYELVTSAVAHGGENGTLRTRWNEDIVLRVEKKLDETRLVAEWKGNHEPPPTLRVKSFVLYMVVDGLNVEVLRAGNQ